MAEYIDREAALSDFEKCNARNPIWTPSRVKSLLVRQHAADVAPVRHGRWIGGYSQTADGEWVYSRPRCEKCGATHDGTTKFCQNCGAKMDKEET